MNLIDKRGLQVPTMSDQAQHIGVSDEWINNPCPHGCDCGDCYSRSPDEGLCHCAERARDSFNARHGLT